MTISISLKGSQKVFGVKWRCNLRNSFIISLYLVSLTSLHPKERCNNNNIGDNNNNNK